MEASAAASWINSVFASFDESVTVAIHNLLYPMKGFFTPFFNFISLLGKGGIALIVLSLLLVYFRKTRKMGTAMALGIAIGFIITNLFLKVVIARPRPYIDESSIFYQLWQTVGMKTESDKSFPSGHTCVAFASMVPLFLTGDRKKTWTALIFAFLMGIARIYLVVHYPTDVIGGLIVGSLSGIAGVIIMTHLPMSWFSIDFQNLFKGKGNRGGGGKHVRMD